MRKQITREQVVEELRQDILREAVNWLRIYEYGCNDPFHTDGMNLMLVRNHIISDKNRLREICTDLPEEYYIPTPPEVDVNYMAKRGEHLQRRLKTITPRQISYTKSVKYNPATETALF